MASEIARVVKLATVNLHTIATVNVKRQSQETEQ